MSILDDIRKCVYSGEDVRAVELVEAALQEGLDPHDILDNALLKGIQDCGKAYEEGTMWIPELLLASEAMKASINILKPHMVGGITGENAPRAVLATVEGDVHDIGVELVGVMLESAGFNVRFLGGNVPTEDIIEAVKDFKPHILGLSTLLSNTMYVVPKILDRLKEEKLRTTVKIMVGGAPIRQEFCEEVGADGYAYDAVEAVPVAKKLV